MSGFPDPPDPLARRIAEARGPEMVSRDGEALMLMARLLAEMHRLRPRLLDLLEGVYNEAQALRLREDDLRGALLPGDAWRSLVVHFLDARYSALLDALGHWRREVGLEHHNALVVALRTAVDPEVACRGPQTTLGDALLAAVERHAPLYLAHNAVEYSVHPVLRLPIYDPQAMSRSEHTKRCVALLNGYQDEVEAYHAQLGNVPRRHRSADARHCFILAMRLTLGRNLTWQAIALRTGTAPGTAHEACRQMAARIGIPMP